MASETIADIVCIMRSEPLYNPHGDPALVEANKVLANYADRIEAAAKRELSRAADDAASRATLDRTAKDAAEYMAYAMAHNSAPLGDAAALRAALDKLRMFVEDINTQEAPLEYGQYSYAIDIVDAALAAPPRNCDMFATVDEAKAEWLRTNAKLLSSTGLMPFESWLFAQADEAKGGEE